MLKSGMKAAEIARKATRFSPILNAQTMGATGGELTDINTVAETASHAHTNSQIQRQSSTIGGFLYRGTVNGGNFALEIDSATTGITINNVNANAGGGRPHNNQPPTIVMNFILKR